MITMSAAQFGAILVALALALSLGLILLLRTRRYRRELDTLAQEQEVALRFVHDVGEFFSEEEEPSLGDLLSRVLRYARRVTGGSAAAIYLLDADGRTLSVRATDGVFPPIIDGVDESYSTAFSRARHVDDLVARQKITLGVGFVGEVAASGVARRLDASMGDPRMPSFADAYLKVSAVLVSPMRFRHGVTGIVSVVKNVDGDSFSETDAKLLQALIDQAAAAIHFAQFSLALQEKRRLDADLRVARRIQQALLPKDLPDFPGVELAAFSYPAQEVGGDYYDVVRIDADHLGIVIADVSGKGISGAILMSVCRSILRTKAPGCLSPVQVLKTINELMSDDASEDMFISMLYMVLDIAALRLTIARAGHTRPILCPAERGDPRTIDSRGVAVGMADVETFDAVIEEVAISLQRGDTVVVYTDGVTEAMDGNENEWGVLNLMKTAHIVSLEGQGAVAVTENVERNLLQFIGDVPQYDDMTLVSLHVDSQGAGRSITA